MAQEQHLRKHQSEDTDVTFKRNRALGYVVKNLYEHAFASYRGRVFMVKDVIPRRGQRWDYPDDVYARMRRTVEAFKEQWYLPLTPKDLYIIEPTKVYAGLETRTSWFRCDNCGKINRRRSNINFNPRCDDCGKAALVQIPVFLGRPKSADYLTRGPTVDDNDLILSLDNGQCYYQYAKCVPGCSNKYLRLVIKDPRQPIRTLTWQCDAGHEKRLISPKSKFFKYTPVLPGEPVTRGCFVSDAAESEKERVSIEPQFWNPILQYAKDVRFSTLSIYEMTYGYRISGLPIRFRTEQESVWTVFGRKYMTKGFVIDVDSMIYKEARDVLTHLGLKPPEGEEEQKLLVLHTIKHVLLRHISKWTGVEDQRFFGGFIIGGKYKTYESEDIVEEREFKDQVYIYETDFGGTGGCKTLFEDKVRLLNYLDDVKKKVTTCDLECVTGYCRACTYLYHCGFRNQKLNRFAAGPFFGLRSDDFAQV